MPDHGLAVTLATIVVSISVVMGVRPVSDPSPWLHLKVGAFLLNGGRFGLPDPWAPFATKAYVPTEWLPAIVGQEIYQAFGLPGIAWMRCAGILGLLSALVWSARRSANTVTAVLVSLSPLSAHTTVSLSALSWSASSSSPSRSAPGGGRRWT